MPADHDSRIETLGAALQRLDKVLAERGLFESRNRAASAVRQGLVKVDGEYITRPSSLISPEARLDIQADPSTTYVSRGALKLIAALDRFAIDPQGLTALDIGASTGGFCEVLLERGAARVFAVDVGHGQLHDRLKDAPNLVSLERTHARDLTRAVITQTPQLITCDVSFISLKKALPAALTLANPGARLIALIKPQFELGRAAIGKGGLVTAGEDALSALCEDIAGWLNETGWRSLGVIDSPIAGGDGNKEFLIGAERS